jgi:hypothetical protein
VHCTPTYSSPINQVERWFAYLTDDLLRRSDHRSVQARRTTSATGWPPGTRIPSRLSGSRPQKRSCSRSHETRA